MIYHSSWLIFRTMVQLQTSSLRVLPQRGKKNFIGIGYWDEVGRDCEYKRLQVEMVTAWPMYDLCFKLLIGNCIVWSDSGGVKWQAVACASMLEVSTFT